jgi:putative ABC transport system substrate-binding protein
MSQPGGNVTGFSLFEFSLGGKWLDLLKEIAPGLARIAVMFNPETAPYSKFFMPVIEAAAIILGVQVIAAPVRATPDIEAALADFARQPNGGLMMFSDSFMRLHQADRRPGRPPSPAIIASGFEFAKDGGLMDYGPNADCPATSCSSNVDRILKGAKPVTCLSRRRPVTG